MKSTGIFGKNSGRVGGVVYSNYRGQQIVKSYQPQVKNPNTIGQIAQRAKFKLVSQVGASLGDEIKKSFVPNNSKETARNTFVKTMLKKTVYSNNEANLPIEEIVLTNSRIAGFSQIVSSENGVSASISDRFGENAKVRVVFIGYNDGGEITQIRAVEPQIVVNEGVRGFEYINVSMTGFSNVRALIYVYEATDINTNYNDYEVLGDNATLDDVLRVYSGKIDFSATENVLIPQNV